MSAKLAKDLLVSHMNALERTMGALEVQTTVLKRLIKEAKGASEETESDIGEDDADDIDEAPATTKGKKKKPAKAAKQEDDEDAEEDQDDEDSEDADEEDESDAEDEDEEEQDDEDESAKKGKGKKGRVISDAELSKAFTAYAKENGKDAALAILKKKFGVKSIYKLTPEQRVKALAAVSE